MNANRLSATMELKQKTMNGASNEIQGNFFQGGPGLEGQDLEVQNELHETSSEMRAVMIEKEKAEAAEGF